MRKLRLLLWSITHLPIGHTANLTFRNPLGFASSYRSRLLATLWTVTPARLLCPWHSPGKNTGVSCHFLLQGDLPDPGVEPTSPVSQADSLEVPIP